MDAQAGGTAAPGAGGDHPGATRAKDGLTESTQSPVLQQIEFTDREMGIGEKKLYREFGSLTNTSQKRSNVSE